MSSIAKLVTGSVMLLSPFYAKGDGPGLPESPIAPANADEIRPFKIQVDESALRDLHERLDRTRLPNAVDHGNWENGPSLNAMKEILEYWRTEYDWRRQEDRLNQFNQ